MRKIKHLALSILIFINCCVSAMDLGYEVAKDLSISCTKALLSTYKAKAIDIPFNTKMSDKTIVGIPCNYCAIALVDLKSGATFPLQYSFVKRDITTCINIDNIAVFASTDNKGIKTRLKDLYLQYAEILGQDAVFKCLPEILDLVRKGDSEQVMLLGLKDASTRTNFFSSVKRPDNIEIIIYSTRVCCQHCNFMLGGFLKEIVQAIPGIQRVRFFYSFDCGVSNMQELEKRSKIDMCLVTPLFATIPFSVMP